MAISAISLNNNMKRDQVSKLFPTNEQVHSKEATLRSISKINGQTELQHTLLFEIWEFEDSQKLELDLLTLLQSCVLETFRPQFPLPKHFLPIHQPSSSGSISGKKFTGTKCML